MIAWVNSVACKDSEGALREACYCARVLNGLSVKLDEGPAGIQPEDGLSWQKSD